MKNLSRTFRNAVLIKEVQVKSKRPTVSLAMMIINIILGLAALITMIAVNSSITSNNGYSSDTFIGFFTVIIVLESITLFFVTPAVSAGAIANERERQTLDVLLTTSMTPWQIIWGKYWSSIATVLMLIVSTLPVLSTVFLFGGVSFFSVLAVLMALVGSVMYLGAFGVFMSTVIKKTSAASVVCYIVLLAVTFGSMMAVGSIISTTYALNEMIWYFNPQLNGTRIFSSDWSIILLLFSPATVAYDLLSKFFDFDFIFGNTSEGMGYFVGAITEDRISSTGFISNLWSLEALVVQLFSAYWILKLAAVNLNPVKRRKKKNVKDVAISQPTPTVQQEVKATVTEENEENK